MYILQCWRKYPLVFPVGFDVANPPSVLIIVPARNEEKNIGPCLDSILQQTALQNLTYTVVVVDDFSTDNTAFITRSYASSGVQLLSLADWFSSPDELKAHKKKAIELAIAQFPADLIACTDADCVVPDRWLRFHISAYMAGYAASTGPVLFQEEKTMLNQFQALDYGGMMLLTGAGIAGRFWRLGNGANFSYSRLAYQEVGGFMGIDQVASGDDVLLLQRIARRFPVCFLKNPEAVVKTHAMKTWPAFWQQRIRWAGKGAHYIEYSAKLIPAFVFALCLVVVLSLLLLPISPRYAGVSLAMSLGSKSLSDYLHLRAACRFFITPQLLRGYWRMQWLHIYYILRVGFLVVVGKKAVWSGRPA